MNICLRLGNHRVVPEVQYKFDEIIIVMQSVVMCENSKCFENPRNTTHSLPLSRMLWGLKFFTSSTLHPHFLAGSAGTWA